MNEEIEYAEMLEIPVSTVNVVKKNHRQRKQKQQNGATSQPLSAPFSAPLLSANPQTASQTSSAGQSTTPVDPLKDSVIAQVNDKINDEQPLSHISAEADLFAEGANSRGNIDFDPVPDRIDTVRLYNEDDSQEFLSRRFQQESFTPDYDPNDELLDENFGNDGGRYALNRKNHPSRAMKIALNTEFALACALCGAIFLTNVFVPNSAINTFFRALNNAETVNAADNRAYTDFTLSPVVSELSDAEFTLSSTGVLSFLDECHVYPAADGKVSEVAQDADGNYTVKIVHSNTFSGIIDGLDHVYYSVGDAVKANVPLGFSDGEGEVQVTMYSNGELLNCFQLTEENCLAWVTEE